jgi:hypothetical protein
LFADDPTKWGDDWWNRQLTLVQGQLASIDAAIAGCSNDNHVCIPNAFENVGKSLSSAEPEYPQVKTLPNVNECWDGWGWIRSCVSEKKSAMIGQLKVIESDIKKHLDKSNDSAKLALEATIEQLRKENSDLHSKLGDCAASRSKHEKKKTVSEDNEKPVRGE